MDATDCNYGQRTVIDVMDMHGIQFCHVNHYFLQNAYKEL